VGYQRHHVTAGHEWPHVLLKAGDAHVRAQPERVRGLLDLLPLRPIADEQRLRRHSFLTQARYRAQQIDRRLLRAQGRA